LQELILITERLDLIFQGAIEMAAEAVEANEDSKEEDLEVEEEEIEVADLIEAAEEEEVEVVHPQEDFNQEGKSSRGKE